MCALPHYINELPKIINTTSVLFADDVTLLYKFKTASETEVDLKQILTKIKDWLEQINLQINFSKTKIIEFRPYQKSQLNINIEIDNNNIKTVSDCTLLGLEIDSHLNWKSHILKVKSKLSRFTYALFKLN